MRVFTSAIALLVCLLYTVNAQLAQDLCEGCIMVNGAGYNSHPTHCDKFVHCRYDATGARYGVVQPCPFSTYWSSDLLTCIPAEKIFCPNDKCVGQQDGAIFGAEGHCRGYWECYNGKAQAKCCPQKQNWNGTLAECVDNIDEDECSKLCFNETEVKKCDMKPFPSNDAKFLQLVHGIYWPMDCAPGTVFVEKDCKCGQKDEEPVIQIKQSCKRELYLPFTSNHLDESGRGYYVKNENVEVAGGVAEFNGVDSRLIIPRFTNLEHSTTVIIKVNYTSDHVTSPNEHAIVSNSDCGNTPSILITEDAFITRYSVGTDEGYFSVVVPQAELPVNETESVKDLLYMYDNGVLSGSNGVITNTRNATGYLKNVHCGLHIGDADDLQSFKGKIDEIEVYLCNPY